MAWQSGSRWRGLLCSVALLLGGQLWVAPAGAQTKNNFFYHIFVRSWADIGAGAYKRIPISEIVRQMYRKEPRRAEDFTLLYLDELDEASPMQLEGLREMVALTRHDQSRLLVTSRSEPPIDVATYFEHITMSPLSERDQMLLLSKSGLGEAEARVVVRRSEGNPLYVANMVSHLR